MGKYTDLVKVLFFVSLSVVALLITAVLSRRHPAPAGISRDSCRAQVSDKRDGFNDDAMRKHSLAFGLVAVTNAGPRHAKYEAEHSVF